MGFVVREIVSLAAYMDACIGETKLHIGTWGIHCLLYYVSVPVELCVCSKVIQTISIRALKGDTSSLAKFSSTPNRPHQ